MIKAITEKSTDHSDCGRFSFSFFCARCGKEWASESTAFNGMGATAIENEEARHMLWANEHRIAFEAANYEARMHFSQCPVCGKRVCDDCFCLEEKEHGGVCVDCLRGECAGSVANEEQGNGRRNGAGYGYITRLVMGT